MKNEMANYNPRKKVCVLLEDEVLGPDPSVAVKIGVRRHRGDDEGG